MATKEPILPPTRLSLKDHPDARIILRLAKRWRRAQMENDTVAEGVYAMSLRAALDGMVDDLVKKAVG